MRIMSIALGGCISACPEYGITQDTGGHIAYILGEMTALAERDDVVSAEIVTRLFDCAALGRKHAEIREHISDKLMITRIDSGNRNYLAKEELAADRAAFTAALIADLTTRTHRPDIIHAHFADAAEVAKAVRDVFGIPFIYTAHSLGRDKAASLDVIDQAMNSRIAEEAAAIVSADAIIGSSRDECERQLLAYPGARIGTIHRITPGTRTQFIDHRAKAQALIAPFLRNPARPVILAIARPVWKKNIAALVEAFGNDPHLKAAANLVIVAGQRRNAETCDTEQGDVFRDLVERIDAHDLYGGVAYPKHHDDEHIAGLYQLAASSRGVFANPALIEPYGLTVVEAAAYGLPVVATRYGGTVDTVTELGHGELVDPRSPQDIAAAIRRLLDDNAYWDQCAANGQSNAQAHTWNAFADQFTTIARSIIAPAAIATAAEPIGVAPRYLLACDLDNTLTGCATGAAKFRKMLESRPNIVFAVATGRSLVEARRLMRQWDLPEPAVWITDVGTRVYWPGDNGPALDTAFPHNVSSDWETAEIFAAADRIDGLTLQPDYDQNSFKCSWFYNDPASVTALHRAIDARQLSARVIASHGRLLDVLPREAGKGAAVLHVAAQLQIARSHILAAGDSGNDIDMLHAASHPIVVANRSHELAEWVADNRVHLSPAMNANGVVEGTEAYFACKAQPRLPSLERDTVGLSLARLAA